MEILLIAWHLVQTRIIQMDQCAVPVTLSAPPVLRQAQQLALRVQLANSLSPPSRPLVCTVAPAPSIWTQTPVTVGSV